MSPPMDSYQRQILKDGPKLSRSSFVHIIFGMWLSSSAFWQLAQLSEGNSVGQSSPGFIGPLGESVFSVCFFCYSAGTGSAFQEWKCQRNKEAPLKRSLPLQKGNISAYPLNNNVQCDSLASDPKKEKRLRTLGNIYTHPFAWETAGLGLCHPKCWIKGTETSTLWDLFRWQSRLESRQRNPFCKSPIFYIVAHFQHKAATLEARIWVPLGDTPSRQQSTTDPAINRGSLLEVEGCVFRPFTCSRDATDSEIDHTLLIELLGR